jgi:hypothetical protein
MNVIYSPTIMQAHRFCGLCGIFESCNSAGRNNDGRPTCEALCIIELHSHSSQPSASIFQSYYLSDHVQAFDSCKDIAANIGRRMLTTMAVVGTETLDILPTPRTSSRPHHNLKISLSAAQLVFFTGKRANHVQLWPRQRHSSRMMFGEAASRHPASATTTLICAAHAHLRESSALSGKRASNVSSHPTSACKTSTPSRHLSHP